MKLNKRLIIAFALLLIGILTVIISMHFHKRVQAPRDFKEIKKSGIIRIATEYNTIGYFVSGDTISGFQYELSKLLEKRFGIHVETTPVMSLEESMKGLSEQKFDIVARPITITTELRGQYLFTQPILLNKQVLVQRQSGFGKASELIRNQIGLAKKTVYVHKNSPAILRILNLSSEIGDTISIQEDDKYGDEQLIALVSGGAIDYAVCDESIARKCLAVYPGIDIETDISFTQLQAWMVRKESKALLDSLNIWLKKLKETEEFTRIYEKYFLKKESLKRNEKTK